MNNQPSSIETPDATADGTSVVPFTQDELTLIWRELSRTNKMVGSFASESRPETQFMVTFFGDSIEHLLYVLPLAHDTLYEEPMAHQVIFRRGRLAVDGTWSSWQRRR